MRHKTTTLILACGLLLLASRPAPCAETEKISLSSPFTATLEFNSENLNSPKRIPQIQFEGTIDILDRQVRVELVNNLTQEPSIALLDISKGTAALLYPDSLNGERMPLGDDFRSNYLDLFTSFASGKKLGEVKGWTLKQSKLDNGGMDYTYSGQSSRKVSFLTTAGDTPDSLRISSPKMTVIIKLGKVDKAASLTSASFTIPSDFAISESKTKLADVLPSL